MTMTREYEREYRQRDAEKWRRYRREQMRRWTAEHPGERRARDIEQMPRQMWLGARLRAKKKGIAFSIQPEDIIVPTHCPLLGTPLSKGVRGPHAASPTLDRVDATKGYEPGNVWVISFRANTLKNDATLEELERLVSGLRKRMQK